MGNYDESDLLIPLGFDFGSQNHKRVIVHVDIDCFYAQVEMILNPNLCGQPIGVQQKNIVVTCNYIARSLGVKKLMSVKDAKEICPNLVLVVGEDLEKYRDMSSKIYEILQSFSPLVEKLGLDENFIDATELANSSIQCNQTFVGNLYGKWGNCTCGCESQLTVGSVIASEIRSRLKDELGITCCAGIAHNKLLAKLVGTTHKPNQQTTLAPLFAANLIQSLKTPHKIPGIGSSTFSKLESLGITTIDEMQRVETAILVKAFGHSFGNQMKQMSLGIDNSEVKITNKPKSIGAEDGFKIVNSLQEIQEKMITLLQRVWRLIEKDGRLPRQVKLTIRKVVFHPEKQSLRESRQTSCDSTILGKKLASLNEEREKKLVSVLISLLHKMITAREKWNINLLGISFSSFVDISYSSNSINKYFRSPGSEPPSKKLRCNSSFQHSDPLEMDSEQNDLIKMSSSNELGNETLQDQPASMSDSLTGCQHFKDLSTVEIKGEPNSLKDSSLLGTYSPNSISNSSNQSLGKFRIDSPSHPTTSSKSEGYSRNLHKTATQSTGISGSFSVPSSQIDQAILNELPSDIRHEIMEHFEIQVPSECHCPEGIDPTVFSQLPIEIQQELVSNQSHPKRSTKQSKEVTILNYFRKL